MWLLPTPRDQRCGRTSLLGSAGKSCHGNLKYGRFSSEPGGPVGVCGDMGEQENLLRFWVMPTLEVPGSGWAGLWVVLCFEVWSH